MSRSDHVHWFGPGPALAALVPFFPVPTCHESAKQIRNENPGRSCEKQGVSIEKVLRRITTGLDLVKVGRGRRAPRDAGVVLDVFLRRARRDAGFVVSVNDRIPARLRHTRRARGAPSGRHLVVIYRTEAIARGSTGSFAPGDVLAACLARVAIFSSVILRARLAIRVVPARRVSRVAQISLRAALARGAVDVVGAGEKEQRRVPLSFHGRRAACVRVQGLVHFSGPGQ